MKPLHCKECDVLLGRIYPIRNDNTYEITSYQFVPYALPEPRQMNANRAIGSPIRCYSCKAETPMIYPEGE